jgi:hypothetical protein
MLVSCAAPTYVAPTTGPVATIRFHTPNPTINNPVLLHTDQCSDKDAKLVGLLYSKAIGTPFSDALEATVPAGKMISVSMLVGDVQPTGLIVSTHGVTIPYEKNWCRAIVDFTPKAGAKYEVVYATDLKQCFYNVNEINTGSNGQVVKVPEPTAKIRSGCKLPGYWAP